MKGASGPSSKSFSTVQCNVNVNGDSPVFLRLLLVQQSAVSFLHLKSWHLLEIQVIVGQESSGIP